MSCPFDIHHEQIKFCYPIECSVESNEALVRLSSYFLRYADILFDSAKYRQSAYSFIMEIEHLIISNKMCIKDPAIIEKIASQLRQKGNKNSTINRKFAVLFKLLRKMHSDGELMRVPKYLRLKERNGRIRFLTADEEARIFEHLRQIDASYHDLAVFLVDTGARVGEALDLKHGDCTETVATFWVTKSNKSRSVPLTARARAIIEQRRSVVGGPFATINYQNFRYAWIKARQLSGLSHDKQVVPHILRHTCASRLVQAGIDLRRVQTFLGHQTIQMTLRYAHLATNDLDQCARALENFSAE